MHRRAMVMGVAAAALLFASTAAHADPVKCKAAIAKNGQAFAIAKMKALQKCEAAVLAGKLGSSTNCHTDIKTQPAIAKAATKLHTAIATACGGTDKICGTPDGDDSPASLSWPALCPGIIHGNCANKPPQCSAGSNAGASCNDDSMCPGGNCTTPQATIDNCEDIAACLECVAESAVDELNSLYHDQSVAHLQAPGSAEQKCQVAIGKNEAGFFAAKQKALGKCWAGKDKGSFPGPCPQPGDGKTQAAIDKAQGKAFAAGCKACGGTGDTDANGSCDSAGLDPQVSIGASAKCPSVQIPGGQNCGTIGALTTLDKLLQCEACVTEFKVDCITPLTVPQDQAYPSQCPPGCGNGAVEAGEVCDDGNTVNGDACPATCTCTTAGTRSVTVSFAGSSNVAGITVLLDYPEGKVSIPGNGAGTDGSRFTGNPASSTLQANDDDSAVTVGVVKTTAFPAGQLFIVQFDTCSGAPVPVNAEFPCTVTAASDRFGADITGVTCSAVVN